MITRRLTQSSRWITADPMRFSCSMVAASFSILLGGPRLRMLNSRRVCSGSLRHEDDVQISLILTQ